MLLGFRPSLGNYVDSEGIVRNDDGTMAVAMETPTFSDGVNDPVIGSATISELACDPNVLYPDGSVCDAVMKANSVYQTLKLQAADKAKPCLGTPVIKGVSNCTLLGVAAAVAVVFMMRD